MSEVAPWQKLLRDALAVLSLLPEEQVRANGPGCLACDLREAFYHAHEVARECAPQLSDVQRGLLERIETALQAMQGPDVECGNDEVVRRVAWQEVRTMAAEALQAFAWQGLRVQPSAEIQPGVWHRPLAETASGAAEDRPDK